MHVQANGWSMYSLPGGSAAYKDFFIAVAVITTVFVTVATISVLAVFGAVIVPIPMLYYYSRLGRLPGVLVLALSLLIAMTILRALGFQAVFWYFFVLGSMGPVLSEVLRKDYTVEKTVICSVSVLLILILVILFYLSLGSVQAPWDIVGAHISTMVHENIELYSRAGISIQHIETLKENEGHIARLLMGLFPAFILAGTAFFTWLNILGGKWLFGKKGMWYPDFGDLTLWKTPDKTVWLVVIAGVFILIPSQVFRILGVNILIVLLFVYMLQGLAIVDFFFERKNVPVIFRALGYILIFAQQLLLFIVTGLGLIDTWADFRKASRKSD